MLATFVLPAPHGCNLSCHGCIVNQRNEARACRLSSDAYIRFLRDILRYFYVRQMALMGYEPLLPETWTLTQRMLQYATAYCVERVVVTNGVHLADYAQSLALLVDRLIISLDSADPRVHDRLRGVAGTHGRVIGNIHNVYRHLSRNDLAVNSILYPGRETYLADMPALLAELGIKRWYVSPFLNIRQTAEVADASYVRAVLISLSQACRRYRIRVILSDEVDRFHLVSNDSFQVETLVDKLFFRLTPDGRCALLTNVAHPSRESALWDECEEPYLFLQRIFSYPLPRQKMIWRVLGAIGSARLKKNKAAS